VERALEHQRARGGAFGEALVELGLVTPAEVEWVLADQYDLPLVQLRPGAIDRATAASVPAEWAREHLVLPVLRDDGTVTAVLADPRKIGLLEEVQRFTGAERVEGALATEATVRELIESVHGPALPSVAVDAFVAEALDAGAAQLGVSARGGVATGWYRREGALVRRALEPRWLDALAALVDPPTPPHAPPGPGVRRWPAVLRSRGAEHSVESHVVGGEERLEWVLRVGAALHAGHAAARVDAPALAAVAAALAAGSAVVSVRPGGEAMHARVALRSALSKLPQALRGPDARSVHVHEGPAEADEGCIFVEAATPLAGTLAALEPFALDAVTVDVARLAEEDVAAARRVAPLVAVRAPEGGGLAAEVRLRLEGAGEGLAWTLDEGTDGAD
jgi:hypothetical protein